jgi:hypothetical protein
MPGCINNHTGESMFINNKYSRWYYTIIEYRKNNPFNGYVERHHIIPKSLGGNNKKENIVALTAREHFICHRLLVKMTSGRDKMKMSYAIRCLVNQENTHQQRYKISSRTYAAIISTTKNSISEYQTGENNPYYGKKHSDEIKAKMREKRALQDPPLLGKNHSNKTKEKLRLANKKQFQDPAQIEMRKKYTLEQMQDPSRRYAAGNGKRGKKWYYCPATKKCSRFFPNEVPAGYIEGRIIKK